MLFLILIGTVLKFFFFSYKYLNKLRNAQVPKINYFPICFLSLTQFKNLVIKNINSHTNVNIYLYISKNLRITQIHNHVLHLYIFLFKSKNNEAEKTNKTKQSIFIFSKTQRPQPLIRRLFRQLFNINRRAGVVVHLQFKIIIIKPCICI